LTQTYYDSIFNKRKRLTMKSTNNNYNKKEYFEPFLKYLFGGLSVNSNFRIPSFQDDIESLSNDQTNIRIDFVNAFTKLHVRRK
jgi:hypothetical protein